MLRQHLCRAEQTRVTWRSCRVDKVFTGQGVINFVDSIYTMNLQLNEGITQVLDSRGR